jgi:NAD(P)-dependent dehydrogenase (short-subunit alcohol dehydrogenase family)
LATKADCVKAGAPEGNVVCVVGEITNENVRKAVVQKAIDSFGAIHILVNNAGISLPGYTCDDSNPIEKFDQQFDVNVKAVISLCKLSADHLIKTKGSIINISSVAGLKPLAQFTYYCMTKCALDMFTQCLAQELAPKGVRVNSINPAAVDTPIITGVLKAQGMDLTHEQTKSIMDAMHPLGRFGTPCDIANAIAFLASDNASWITGISMKVDGGAMIKLDGAIPK